MGVLGTTTKKVGFKRLPKDPVPPTSDSVPEEEKKSEESEEQPFSTDDTAPTASAPTAIENNAMTGTSPKAARINSPKHKQGTTTSDPVAVVSPEPSPIVNNQKKSPSNHNKSRKMFRLPNVFKHRRNGSSGSRGASGSQGDSEEDEEIILEQEANTDDPVMAVFQSRYKNRVRWALEGQPLAGQYTPETVAKKENSEKLTDDNKKTATSSTRTSKVTFQIDVKEEEGALDQSATLTAENIERNNSNNGNSNAGVPASNTSPTNSSIMKFVKGALFGAGTDNKAALDKEFHKEVAKEVEAEKDLVWESNNDTAEGGEIVYTSQKKSNLSPQAQQQLTISFTENPKTRAAILKLIKKGRRAQEVHFRYDYAIKYFVRAMDMLTKAKYPDAHPTVRKALNHLNEAHHKQSSYNNSANIVKIGIKYEDSGELVRALKMYSIAYRIRRDNLSRKHPSLVVLLNMIGSIQTKRGEYAEAMQVYELALKDPGKEASSVLDITETPASAPTNKDEELPPPPLDQQGPPNSKGNLLARSVTYREMGTIFEKWNRLEDALKMYNLSLDCVAEWKAAAGITSENKGLKLAGLESLQSPTSPGELEEFMEKVRVSKSYHNYEEDKKNNDDDQTMERGEMEMSMNPGSCNEGSDGSDVDRTAGSLTYYDSFFPPHLDTVNEQKGRSSSSAAAAAMASGDMEGLDRRDDYADIDVALTIHQIAQLFRKQGHFTQALDAYAVALRGMKYSLGNSHPNVAAILGNFGNLQKEMGDLNAAYDTYQEVLGIESYRLGLSHPDVAITLHNIATIDAARGNHQRALTLYRQVMCLQEKLFGEEHISIAVTAACMGDVYEQLGQMKDAFESYEDSLRIKSAFQGPHTLEVARILHKLAKVALKRMDHRLASTYISRAIFAYRLNKLLEDHEWVIDAHRDSADIDASLALAKNMTFEC